MRSPHCVFGNRLIALSICLCALLAFSTTLRASNYTFVLGAVNSSESYLPSGEPGNATAVPVGPYAGVLTNTVNGTTDPNYLFFCITGGNTSNTGNPGYTGSESAPTSTSTEEAAYLASLALSTAVLDKINIVSSNGTSVSLTQTGSMLVSDFVKSVLGPIQMAIWQVMGSLPSEAPWHDGSNDTNAQTDVGLAVAYVTAHPLASSYSNYIIFTPDNTSSQTFIQVPGSVPEPGTMILFGTGVLPLGLGSTRKLLARRRAR